MTQSKKIEAFTQQSLNLDSVKNDTYTKKESPPDSNNPRDIFIIELSGKEK